jgi:putative hydrolase of the HAD superfamily
VNAKAHGYGSKNFGRNLTQCYQRLAEREIRAEDLDRVVQFAEAILDQPIELIDRVAETLEYLSMRHDLTLFTKGDPEEQKLKVLRSGVGMYFGHTAIVKEKNADAYRDLVRERALAPERAWMVGNSPKSDINPALEAGLNAVFVPHPHTWSLEKEQVRTGPGKFLRLERFSDLRLYF